MISSIFHKLNEPQSFTLLVRFVVLYPSIEHIFNILVSSFDTTLLCEWQGFPWTIFRAVQNPIKLVATLLENFLPLLDCNIDATPSNKNMFTRFYTTSSALFDVRAFRITNFVR
ncbi:hypothetical protein AVEN_274181-1 [Araneus ventricosus]|uniref:Uncharacterized protein n=1 Tax=Araneus ventricosus TaxID=182803 RepID=A0A4Y2THM7_ARAVE|nr:hypothetical protein AVEN_274181-1 [Araneus ventricosus]